MKYKKKNKYNLLLNKEEFETKLSNLNLELFNLLKNPKNNTTDKLILISIICVFSYCNYENSKKDNFKSFLECESKIQEIKLKYES